MSGKSDKKEQVACNCYTASRPNACPPLRNVTHPLRYYEFTPDEIKALEECDKESFYRRCLPFSTVFATAAYTAIRYGLLRRSVHFGAVPKVAIAAFLGYAWGRVASVPHCEEKLRALPGHLGDVMRRYHLEKNPPPKDLNKR